MHCRTCGYGLWNLKARTCPECGEGFRPSDFTFTPNAVRFRCPHCTQEYYGTDERGHLVPPAFACVRCQNMISMDDCILEPAEGASEAQTVGEINPWAYGTPKPFLKRFFKTCGQALVQPGRMAKGTPAGSSVGRAFVFAVLVGVIGASVNVAIWFGMFFVSAAAFSGGGGGGATVFGWMLGTMLAGWLGYALVPVIVAVLCGLVTHGLLKVTGGAPKSLRTTLTAILYASGANIISAVPCCGYYVGIPWWIVCASIAVVYAQGVKGWRGAIATALPPVTLIVLLIAGYFSLIFGLAGLSRYSGMGSGGPTIVASSDVDTFLQNAHGALKTTVDARLAAGDPKTTPEHLLVLATEGGMNVSFGFVVTGSGTNWSMVQGAPGISLVDFSLAAPSQQRSYVASAAASSGGPVHRVGDLVATFAGMDFSSGLSASGDEGDLWVFIASPDPGQGLGTHLFLSAPLADETISVIDRNGALRTITDADLAAELAKQNMLRAKYGLPLISDPRTIY